MPALAHLWRLSREECVKLLAALLHLRGQLLVCITDACWQAARIRCLANKASIELMSERTAAVAPGACSTSGRVLAALVGARLGVLSHAIYRSMRRDYFRN
jgi:hypothetical protein